VCFDSHSVLLTVMYQCLYQFRVSVCIVLSDMYVQHLNIRKHKYKSVEMILISLKYFVPVPTWMCSAVGCTIVVFLYSCPTDHITDHLQ
jgi:hypothetical protein